ncbi:MAG: GNAT family N-acetyltransferase [Verrucomicrobia bacterium]|nr:GNAT family N-acetyltransferase [Verrucomicrobiota bacterium]MBI3867467.1 GNAT family N-acetyltransferase [Verrucomicrobiota bacterium]
MSKLRSLVQQLRTGGLRGVISLLRSNLFNVDRCLRLELDLTVFDFTELPPCPPDYLLRRSDQVDLERVRAAASTPLPQDFFEDRIHGLTEAYLGFLSGELVHVLWLAVSGQPSTVSGFRPKPREAEMRNVITVRPARGRGILTYSVRAAAADMKRKGFERVYAHIAENNTPSLRGFQRAGFVPTQRVVLRRVLGWDCVEESALSPQDTI